MNGNSRIWGRFSQSPTIAQELMYQSPCLKSTLSYATTGQLVNMGEFKECKSAGTE